MNYVGVICKTAQDVVKAYDILVKAGYSQEHMPTVEIALSSVLDQMIADDDPVAVGVDKYRDILGVYYFGDDGDCVATFENLVELANEHFPL